MTTPACRCFEAQEKAASIVFGADAILLMCGTNASKNEAAIGRIAERDFTTAATAPVAWGSVISAIGTTAAPEWLCRAQGWGDNCANGMFVVSCSVAGRFRELPADRLFECYGSVASLQCTSPTCMVSGDGRCLAGCLVASE